MAMNDARTLENELVRMVGILALELHKTGSEELSCDLLTTERRPTSENNTVDYQIDNGKLCFTSLESRNRVVSAHTFNEKRDTLAADSEQWITVAHDLWRHEIRSDDSSAGRLLALVHETHDIFTIAADAINSKTIKVFDALLTVESALRYLKDLPPDGIWKLCEVQYDLTKNDMAAGMFFGSLGKTLVGYPDVCRRIHDRLRKDISEATANLHPTVVVALAGFSPDEAVQLSLVDAESPNSLLKSIALWTLGRLIALSLVDHVSLPRVSEVLISNISTSTDSVRKTAILAAAGATPVTDAFVESLNDLGSSADQVTLGAIAQTLWANLAEMKGKAYFHSWLRFLCKVPSSSEGILDRFDHVLSRLLSDPSHQEFALSCFTEWVTINGKGTPRDQSITELFDTVTIELARHPELLSEVLTDWLLADEKRLPSAAAGLLSYLGIHGLEKPEFKLSKLATLQHVDLLFLARRLLGFVFSENHLLSLTMSFFKTNDAPNRTFGILRSLLVDEVGYDYPYSTIEALESAEAVEERTEFKVFYSNTSEAIKSQMKALNGLPRLVELSPPPNLQRQFVKARSKQISKAMGGERKKSILRQILTEVPIKAGIGYFSFHEGAYSEPAYLKSISHSVTLPRRSTLDTVGAEMRLWSLSNAKREYS